MSARLFRAKYVVLLRGGLEVPVILPEAAGMKHNEAAAGAGHPVAAGFCELFTLGDGALGFTVEGESVGLQLHCRPDRDPALLNKHYLEGGFSPRV